MKVKPTITALLLLMFLLPYQTSKPNIGVLKKAPHQDRPELDEVSIISLIANPEKYHKKRVIVIGYLTLYSENCAIYVHKTDCNLGISKNGVWVDMMRDSMYLPEIQKLNNKYALIEGIFDKNFNGHMLMWSGSITNVNRIISWPPDIYPPKKKKATKRKRLHN
ncbi:hypothetical protein IM792_10385 [Mucilaginibacter sp. JRF]|uniref:hypothetical protein n=1 Tax=Mucilaginibacter sp. JRF TaxID=2780088 RepID=UPI00187E5150|nr:hypothetical protein [Mucilaginibacter sp. JRF]MBE9584855.1 hypothetical protein [Mucilaginibacter sp. JRF]